MKNDHDRLDDLIDRALPGYSVASPVEGLEDRVLGRIQTAGAERRVLPFRLLVAIPAVAALLVAGIFLPRLWESARPAITSAPTTADLKPPLPRPESPRLIAQAPRAAKPKAQTKNRRKPGAARPALPKQRYFPTPLPMTDEEHALLAWAGRAPAETRQAFLDLKKRTDEPVEIQTIQIRPLPGDGAQ